MKNWTCSVHCRRRAPSSDYCLLAAVRSCGALEQGEFDLLHLIAHGEFAGTTAADTSAVLVEDGTFRVAELTPSMAGALRRAPH